MVSVRESLQNFVGARWSSGWHNLDFRSEGRWLDALPSPYHRVVSLDKKRYPSLSLSTQGLVVQNRIKLTSIGINF